MDTNQSMPYRVSVPSARATLITALVIIAATIAIYAVLTIWNVIEVDFLFRLIYLFFMVDGVRMWIMLLIGALFYRSFPADPTYTPRVSVLIPAWNEEVGIQATIRSVLANEYPNIEIIVINDGSKDQTAERVQAVVDQYPDKVKLITQTNGGKWSALNTGHEAATGEIMVCIDADSYMYPTAIRNIVKHYKNPRIDAVVGYVVVGNTKTWVGKLQYLEYLLGFHLKRTQHVMNTIHILSGAISSYRASVFKEHKLHYTSYSKTEDMDLSLQMRQKRLRLVHAHDAWCATEGASDLKSLINQRVRWRYGGLLCYWKHRNLFFNFRMARKLGWYEFPNSMTGIFQIAIYPLILAAAYIVPIAAGMPLFALFAFCSMYVNFTIILATSRHMRQSVIPWLPLVSLFMYAAMLVEFVALFKAVNKIRQKKELQWTAWKRQGALDKPIQMA